MNKELIKQWLTALRSGKYKQIKYLLSNGKGYCCLGVACLIHPSMNWDFNRIADFIEIHLLGDVENEQSSD